MPQVLRSPYAIPVCALWALAVYGATQLHKLDLPIGHGICGPWGCAAAPEALLGYHLLWTTLLAPPFAAVCCLLPTCRAQRLTKLVLMLGLLGVLSITVCSAAAWLWEGQAARYALQRGLFVVATTPDLPVIPLSLAGLSGLYAKRACLPLRPEVEEAPSEESFPAT